MEATKSCCSPCAATRISSKRFRSPALAIHGLGIVLIVARLCHAFGLKAETIEGVGRSIGAAGSMLVVLVASIWAIVTVVA